MADGLAELAVRWPSIAVVFCETRALTEEWTYRYLAAACQWATSEDATAARIGIQVTGIETAPATEGPSTAEVRAWARANNIPVSDRGKLPQQVWAAWQYAHRDAGDLVSRHLQEAIDALEGRCRRRTGLAGSP